jgi:hypothetical protein
MEEMRERERGSRGNRGAVWSGSFEIEAMQSKRFHKKELHPPKIEERSARSKDYENSKRTSLVHTQKIQRESITKPTYVSSHR